MRMTPLLGLILGGLTLSHSICLADGVFVFRWNKQIDINEPTQKAILLHDQGREDLVLQVKYEGPAEEFGWLIPVPGLPAVRKGSMDCFYELSRLTQERGMEMTMSLGRGAQSGRGADDSVKVIEVKTVGAYEVAVLSAGNAGKLTEWLEANDFVFPKEKRDVLDSYIKKQWYFVAAKIDPNGSGFVAVRQEPRKGAAVKKTISQSTRRKLASGELHPLVISFPSEKCVFPLAISAVNGKPAELSLYVLSAEPLMNGTIFDKKFAAYSRERAEWIQKAGERRKPLEEMGKEADKTVEERFAERGRRLGTNANNPRRWPPWDDDPADPRPPDSTMRRLTGRERFPLLDESDDDFYGEAELVWSMEASPKDLRACAKELPRLAGKSWWLTKQVEVFAPEEMRDLEFEAAIPILARKLPTPDGQGAAACLSQFGVRAVPAVLAGVKSSDPVERRSAASALAEMSDPRLTPAIPALLTEADARIRVKACYAAGMNWNASFAPRLAELFNDSDGKVRSAAGFVMAKHRDDSLAPIYRKMVEEDGVAASLAINMLDITSLSRAELMRFFSSTNLPVVATAFGRSRYSLTVDELAPLLTNSLPMARLIGLGGLVRIGDKPAMDRIVSMLHDPNEAVAWNVRARLRRLSGQKLGAEPAAYEKWWAENRETFSLPPSSDPRRPMPIPGAGF